MTAIVELRNVTKRFPGVVALRDMGLSIEPGEIHGLIGENGAGKSTLIKVLTGVYVPEEGDILVDGEPQRFTAPRQSQDAGIACVYQELNIVKQLSLTDNIFLNQFIKGRGGLLDYTAMHAKAEELLTSMGINVDVTQPAGIFGMGVLQMVEIAKALLTGAKLIIMDEPTSSLGESEVEQLIRVVRSLKANGVAILFVSHKLEELFILCDRVTVMRDGQHIVTENIEDLDNDKLIRAMVGRNVENQFPKVDTTPGKVAIEFRNVTSVGTIKGVSFQARYGEILGFSGLVGAGRTETMRAIFGDLPIDSGEVLLDGVPVTIASPQRAVQKGIAFLTEDRKGQGLVLNQSIATNLILASLKKVEKGPLLDKGKVTQMCDESIASMRIKTPDAENQVSKLSGGNQQKVVIGKWINSNAEIYLFDEPTRGIDVGAKVEVYNIMNRLASAGKCIIMVSSELPEVMGMSDRVIVMRGGEVMAEIGRDDPDFNEDDIMKAAWGERKTA
ncbi:D-xylose ABC transporter ATP-binding protein [Tessaracoccus aquimaris]|uniref:D-xylose ABC transporter ATP-binding protein n=1 Tax=Tessaracoccus aquimaris TaxID=1332264 RepID=A0A1Q2CQQ0_9ACTN|nr:sugar ABC transporter ATP-binding protein [Tessaracoccus aquimaris]AQP48458.1 D-xylose ABC transporter ATP-binding protein [Tessaracoccus aquimaris]